MTQRTGRLLSHDPRSRGFAATPKTVTPVSVLHRLDAPALDQGNLSGCTGFAAAQWLNCGRNLVARRRYHQTTRNAFTTPYVKNYDGRALYSVATYHDDFDWLWPDIDNGSSGLGVAKALKVMGTIDRYEWTFSFGQFLAYAQHQPVLVGTAWTDSMFDPDGRGIIRVTGSLDGSGGHEYLVRGVNWPRKLIRIRNSWSADWGIKGDAYIYLSDMERLLAAQGDCVVPVVTPVVTPGSWWAAVI